MSLERPYGTAEAVPCYRQGLKPRRILEDGCAALKGRSSTGVLTLGLSPMSLERPVRHGWSRALLPAGAEAQEISKTVTRP